MKNENGEKQVVVHDWMAALSKKDENGNSLELLTKKVSFRAFWVII